MNLGLALYGRSFTLANSQNTSVGASIIEGGGEGKINRWSSIQGFVLTYPFSLAGPYTKEEGILAYFEVMRMNERKTIEEIWRLDLSKITCT